MESTLFGHLTCVFPINKVLRSSFLYVVSAIPRAVDVFSLDGPGQAEHIQRLDVAGFAKSVGITIGKFTRVAISRGTISTNAFQIPIT